MLSKLTSVQFECVSLIEMVRSYQEEAASLKAKIAEIEDFQQQAEGYKLNKLDSGTLVYSKKQFIGDTEITVHLCPQCFGKKVISVLQPMEIMRLDAHFRTFCPACNNKFWMNSR
ncbi:hypothetical protein B6R18_26135 [Escherichia coli]|nr:hypothetical protein [Escherichia coli]EEV1304545.1 hypothetical protein [Escherichia coli]EEW0700453.1 hypothetical protein [Escherichia coli]EEW1188006.1 hypothetical protein [Escherichia coli]EEW2576223.1 hypothetical protein [Escherichia coli]